MNILMLIHEYHPVGGGAGVAAYQIAHELKKAGHSVHVFTTNFNGKYPKTEEQDGIHIVRVPGWRHSIHQNRILLTFSSFLLFGLLRLPKYIRKHKIDSLHAFFTLPAGLLGVLLKKLTGNKVVLSLRGSDVPYHNPESKLHLARPLIRFIWKNSDHVVALSQGLMTTAHKTSSGVKDVIYNGVSLEDFHPGTANRDLSDKKPLRLISTCRLEKIKGLQFLLPAISELIAEGNHIQLQVAGEGPYRPQLEALIQELNLKAYVSLLGHRSREQLRNLYAGSDVFVLPSLTESFGQVFTEAMACGLPVLGTRVGGIPEIITEDVGGWLVEAQNTQDLKSCLREVYALSAEKLRALGARNAELVKERFSWEGVTQKYLELYRAA